MQGKWDGLWRFTYAHGIQNLFDASKAASASFDVLLDPIQQATERALVSLYLRGDAPDGGDFAKIDRAAKTMSVDTPRTQGGFGHAGCAFATSGMDVRLAGAHGAVWATSVDGKPLAEPHRRAEHGRPVGGRRPSHPPEARRPADAGAQGHGRGVAEGRVRRVEGVRARHGRRASRRGAGFGRGRAAAPRGADRARSPKRHTPLRARPLTDDDDCNVGNKTKDTSSIDVIGLNFI